MTRPTLHLIQGGTPARRATRAREIAWETGAIVLDEAVTRATLWPRPPRDADERLARSARLAAALDPVLRGALGAGVGVVLSIAARDGVQQARLARLAWDARAACHLHDLRSGRVAPDDPGPWRCGLADHPGDAAVMA